MSRENSDPVRDQLRAYARDETTKVPSPAVVGHMLDLLEHYEMRVKALQKIADAAVERRNAECPADGEKGAAKEITQESVYQESIRNETVCQEADRIVSFDRQATYGHPAEDMMRTGAMWEAILGVEPGKIGPEQVAMCMIAVKLSRLCHGMKRDSVVDICGYAKCLDIISEWRKAQG